MKPEIESQRLLGVARSKAKMLEYHVPEKDHIVMPQDPSELFILSIGLLGEQAARISRGEINPNEQELLKNNLIFSARFFDSYLQTKLNEDLDPYLTLLGASSYYLCDLPGSASVLAIRLSDDCPDLGGEGLEDLLLWLLQANLSTYFEENCSENFGVLMNKISQAVLNFFEEGSDKELLLSLAIELRNRTYEIGSPRQLLLADIITAILNKKIKNSCWNALPEYSGLSLDKWSSAIKKDSFIKELWPAQHLLGQKEVLKGKSAVVQMPTSAGKTKAIELILRSAFLADRAHLAVIVAPFRALCHEIKNNLTEAFRNESVKVDEFSDVMQMDVTSSNQKNIPDIPTNMLEALFANIDISQVEYPKQVIVVTPEKLLYVLRHVPTLASDIGLLVFDEGHQFDSGTRGITYELLLTSLRSMIQPEAQKVLISAVINNAEAVGEWLNGDPNVVEGSNLNPTFRSVGFTSWLDRLGRIEYVDSQHIEQNDFFVPRIIESLPICRKLKERKNKFFPIKTDSKEIALYLSLKLVANGSVAIFCGTKATATSICNKAVDIFERQVSLSPPHLFSSQEEIECLTRLHAENLGHDSPSSKSAALGIFGHHGNTPHGIRLAVEYAMHENLIHFVVCTSTLAQGVNLPLRYLIITNFYQGMERIKVRDFHNLIGRAGRAGMHTEGSILFSDHEIYDNRKVRRENFLWKQAKTLLDPSNSEPCISNLLSLFEPIKNDQESHHLKMEALSFVKLYIKEPDAILRHAKKLADKHANVGFSQLGIEKQMLWKIGLICAVESFLLAHWDENDDRFYDKTIVNLAESTLGYFLADEQQKENIKALFKLLAENIVATVTESEKRHTYGRTLYGLHKSMEIESWLSQNFEKLANLKDPLEFIECIWTIFSKNINNSMFKKYDSSDTLKKIVKMWISGEPFVALLDETHRNKARMIYGNGNRRREFSIEHMVEICEGGLAFDGSLFIGAMCELIDMLEFENATDLIKRLQTLQKRMQYGLPSEEAIGVYELGFADRVIAQKMADELGIEGDNKKKVIKWIKKYEKKAREIISQYPKYFQQRLDDIIKNS
ncbi:DEAD/DEAH box helicase [Desulfovibrio litoralis]|uniref:Helicase conserved C-terminal domain-containing protein n=1 Tax=Desulfovibrio litoralis DSM 11393 TaxID=1121455 RepID=A0A1M7SZJ4_9BACT|nr:DEAD/DEAH box helicase [Desulfovibrio litoralis]SHN63834.1 Helicase conserved C-terminal domain-containing protein [Desulfovibrio litoralis DSM 11393]